MASVTVPDQATESASPRTGAADDTALSAFEQRLLENSQRDLAVEARPFLVLARVLGTSEEVVVQTFVELHRRGILSRVGPVLEPRACGASTLAALAVAPERLESVAAIVNSFPEVNHNYAREHHYNLWFVLTAANRKAIDRVLAEIAARTTATPLDLPMLRAYHIDLGFCSAADTALRRPKAEAVQSAVVSALGRRLIIEAQDGLPLTPRPYAALANRLGETEQSVLAETRRLLAGGAIKRIGAVVRHRRLGLTENAMTVWDVPDTQVHEYGRRLATHARITLCYARRRQPPHWPYNLFCMVHARQRDQAHRALDSATLAAGLGDYPREVLFSTRCFRQRGARYAPAPTEIPDDG